MRMSKNQRNYVPLIFPDDKSFKEMSKTEAQAYFDWFTSHVDERSEYLRKKVSEGLKISMEALDFSMESLIPIWRWFLEIVELQKTPKAVLRNLRKELKANGEPEEFIEDIIRENSAELSVFSRYVMRDIGMYVGKMFVTNFQTLRWDYHTDIHRDSFANIPQIFGFVDFNYDPPFEDRLDPIHCTEMAASNILDNTENENENDLYNLCMIWLQWIPKATRDE